MAASQASSGDAHYDGHARRRAAWPYSFGGFSRVVSDGLGDGRDMFGELEEPWEHPAQPHAREAQGGNSIDIGNLGCKLGKDWATKSVLGY